MRGKEQFSTFDANHLLAEHDGEDPTVGITSDTFLILFVIGKNFWHKTCSKEYVNKKYKNSCITETKTNKESMKLKCVRSYSTVRNYSMLPVTRIEVQVVLRRCLRKFSQNLKSCFGQFIILKLNQDDD